MTTLPPAASAGVVHFWPGPFPLHRTPGAHAPCGAKGVPLLGTAALDAVTCKRCRRSAAFMDEDVARGRAALVLDGPALWTREQLLAFGLVDQGAPDPEPQPPPYRNPRLAPPVRAPLPPGPLAAMVARWDKLGERMPGEVRAALTSCANELHDFLAEAAL